MICHHCWCENIIWEEMTSSYSKALEYYHKVVLKHSKTKEAERI